MTTPIVDAMMTESAEKKIERRETTRSFEWKENPHISKGRMILAYGLTIHQGRTAAISVSTYCRTQAREKRYMHRETSDGVEISICLEQGPTLIMSRTTMVCT